VLICLEIEFDKQLLVNITDTALKINVRPLILGHGHKEKEIHDFCERFCFPLREERLKGTTKILIAIAK
jgi:hypothetical protein